MRSLLHTEPVDFLIGNTYGKYLERDCGTPLMRWCSRSSTATTTTASPPGVTTGGLWLLTMLLDEFFETLDANTNVPGKTDYSFDIIR
jgi:nitrogenase molybdenum-iron protein beta chain